MKIRSITTDDIYTVGRIYEEAFSFPKDLIKAYYKGFTEYVEFCMSEGYAFIAGDEDSDYGVVLAYEIPDMEFGKELYVELLAIVPSMQGKGYGKTLMKKVLEIARIKGVRSTSIRTKCYIEAYDIYKKMGYRDMQSDLRFMSVPIDKVKI